MGAECDKVRLYTTQSPEVVKILENEKICHVKKEHINKKYQEVSYIFLEAYNWYISKAKDIVKKPEGVEYPYWAFTEPEFAGWYPGNYMLILEIPINNVIFFRNDAWNRILNMRYLPQNEEDEKKYNDMLKKYNISNELDIFNKPFYPQLKSEVKKSWDNLFLYDKLVREEVIPRDHLQASLWEIKSEWIIEKKFISTY